RLHSPQRRLSPQEKPSGAEIVRYRTRPGRGPHQAAAVWPVGVFVAGECLGPGFFATGRGLLPLLPNPPHPPPPFLKPGASPAPLPLRSGRSKQRQKADRRVDAGTKRRLVVDRRRNLSASRNPQVTRLPLV